MSQALIEFLILSIGAAVWIACIIQLARKSQELANFRKYAASLESKRADQDFTNSILRAKVRDLAFRADFPLFYVSDEDLPEVIKEELEIRHANSLNPTDHKLASKCGGKAFRVVDAIKRGKL